MSTAKTIWVVPNSRTKSPVSRNLMLLLLEDIPRADHGMNQLLLERLVDLLAKHVHVDVDHVALVVEVDVPNMLADLDPGKRAVGIPEEVLKKRKLLRRES